MSVPPSSPTDFFALSPLSEDSSSKKRPRSPDPSEMSPFPEPPPLITVPPDSPDSPIIISCSSKDARKPVLKKSKLPSRMPSRMEVFNRFLDSSSLWLYRADFWVSKGDLDFLLEVYGKFPEAFDQNFELLDLLAESLYDNDRFDEALQFLDKALKLRPNASSMLYYKTKLLIYLERFNEAEKTLRSLQALSFCTPTIYLMAYFYSKKTGASHALNFLREYSSAEFRSISSHIDLLWKQLEPGSTAPKTPASEGTLQKIFHETRFCKDLSYPLRFWIRSQNFSLIERFYEQEEIRSKIEEDPSLLSFLGASLLGHAFKTEERRYADLAIALCDRAIQQDPGAPMPLYYKTLGLRFLNLPRMARASLEELQKIAPSEEPTLYLGKLP